MQDDVPNHPIFREEVLALLKRHGFEIGKGTLNKICAPGCDPDLRERYGAGPPVVDLWPIGRGRNRFRPRYDPLGSLNWAKSLLQPPLTT